jgi:hypothetical protein
MSLRALALLVALILVGTGLSVRAFLHAGEAYGAEPVEHAPEDGCGDCPAGETGETVDPLDPARPDVGDPAATAGDLDSTASLGERRDGSGWVHCPPPCRG